MNQSMQKFPDEDEVEKILDMIHDLGWNNLHITEIEEVNLLSNFTGILKAWSTKYFGKDDLFEIINENYLVLLTMTNEKIPIYKELDLVICFFQHYIYAFEEFMTREFRDAVIRCGLVCERLVKRMAVAGNHPEINDGLKFEDRANKLANVLSSREPDIQFLVNRMKYIYSNRSKKAAHDTGAAGILIAKSCVSELPTAYMEYLEAIEKISFTIKAKDALIALVNSTAGITTTLIVVKHGEPAKPESVLTNMYSNGYFGEPKKLSGIQESLSSQGHNIKKPLLCTTLDVMCREKMLIKKSRGIYVQRTPPTVYYSNKIVE